MKHVLVTGGNRGIGLALCKALVSANDDVFVWLGSRSVDKARAAIDNTIKESEANGDDSGKQAWESRVAPLELDVTSQDSVDNALKQLKEANVTLHCLVNNAGVAMDLPWAKGSYDTSICKPTLDVNYHGVVRCFHAFSQILDKDEGRVVTVSSGAANQNMEKMSAERQADVMREDLTEEEVDAFVKSFAEEYGQQDAKNLPCASPSGWHLQVYGFSKAMVNALTRVWARDNSNLLITCCTPGFVDTEMVATYTGDSAKKSVEEGIQTPLWLATGSPDKIKNGRMYGNDLALLTWVGYNVDESSDE